VPLLPITLGGRRPGVRIDPPALGAHGAQLLETLGLSATQIAALTEAGVVGPVN